MRTTIDIDDPILKELKKLRKTEGKSLGRMISDLLAQALQGRKMAGRPSEQPRWISKDMRARINLDDKEAVYAALDDRRNSADRTSVKP
ncbi:MAG: ribbon-helix-helix protein, CopG family [Thermodesulfovibrionales bacterium]|jgi:mRNA-degrading endonuclease RelE of RelBE toxin-antitoxin system